MAVLPMYTLSSGAEKYKVGECAQASVAVLTTSKVTSPRPSTLSLEYFKMQILVFISALLAAAQEAAVAQADSAGLESRGDLPACCAVSLDQPLNDALGTNKPCR